MSQFLWMVVAALLGAVLARPAERVVHSWGPRLWLQARNRYRQLRFGRRPLASWAGWLDDTRYLLDTRERQAILDRLDEAQLLALREAPHGIPYMKLRLAHELGMTVSQFESLPYNEQLAWQTYFALPEASRDGFYNRRVGEAIDELREEGVLGPPQRLRCSWSGCRSPQVDNAMCKGHAREWRKRYGGRADHTSSA